tara:strand:+ start:1574 stop:1852 length:279 start_codon:yes stop_codon:yes gene_type:complete
MGNVSQYWGRQLIAKKNTHFKYSTRVFVVDDYGDGNGLFRGIRICENTDAEMGYINRTVGEEYVDEKICSFDEFYNIGLYQGIFQFLNAIED